MAILLERLFGQTKCLKRNKDGKVADRGRRRTLATFVVFVGGLTIFLLLCLSQLAVAQGTFSPTGSMLFERTYFTLTRLADGRVLAAGANGAGNVGLNTAEVYDPTTGKWSLTGSMRLPRGFHTATLLKNGKVLVVGGANAAAALSSAELYDPVTGTWSLTGSMSVPRHWHMAFPLKDGRVLVTGGYFLQSSSEIYDPQTGQWSPTGSMVKGRYLFDGVVLLDGRVLVAGGLFGSELAAEIYDPTTGKWSSTGPLNYPRGAGYSLTRLADGRVLLAGGTNNGASVAYNQAEIFDPATGVWTPTTFMPRTSDSHSATLLLDGTVLVTGSHVPRFSQPDSLIFNPVSQTWTVVAGTLPFLNQAVRLLDGRVLVAGGALRDDNIVVGPSTAQAFLFTGGAGTGLPLLTLDVSAPSSLAVVNGSYAPNPFTITATLTNTGAATAQNVELSLSLPQGLTLTEGSATQSIADVPTGQQRQVVWNVRAAGQTQDVTRSYLVTAVHSKSGKTVSGQIILPGGALTIGAITPKAGGDIGSVTIHVNGGGFLDGATVKLVRNGESDIPGNAVSVAGDGFSAAARFDLTGKPRGLWSVVVTNPSGTTAMLTDAFTVEEGRTADVWVQIIGSSSTTIGRPSTFYVFYGNRGNVDAVGVPIVIGGIPRNATWRLGVDITPPPTGAGQQPIDWTQVPVHIDTGSEIVLPLVIGHIVPEGTGVLPITVQASTSFTLRVKNWALRLGDALCSENSDCFRALGVLPLPLVDCLVSIYCFHKEEVPDDVGSLIAQLVGVILECAAELLPKLPKSIESAKLVFSILTDCITTLGDSELRITVIDPRAGGTSHDPNDKVGVHGVGPSGFITGDLPLPYAILFENLDTATAPAHEIVITDQLNGGALDLTTFSLGLISFGDTLIVPPAGLSQYAIDVDLRPANNLIVRINAGLDMATGLVTWHFVSLDPTTMLPPDDSQIGFLPPNVTPPAGDGAVLFTVKPKPGLPTGMEIRNQATIVFDTNDPINTPEWFNTLDNTKPDSSILLLSATQPSPTFTVQWSGIDVGSGILDYTIFVSENGGPFTAELINTRDTSATFTGQVGKTYAFYSIARDQTGNLEDAPTVPDATTQVVGADQCPNDPNKTEPGVCGCGVADVDSDGDGVLNCLDGCPSDPAKTAPGVCGCGVTDTDSDSDGTPDCHDACPTDPSKTGAGVCGCGVADTDSDGDGTPDCHDACPSDPNKTVAGVCGCGVADTDSDGDGVANCRDNCPTIANPDQKDSNGDGKGDACTEVCGNCRDDDGDGLVDLRDPDCPSSGLAIEKGVLTLKPDPQEDKITLRGTFAGAANSINPPAEGVTISLIDTDGLITCLNIPPGAGWKTSKGPKWVFKDKKDGSLGDPEADEKVRIEFNPQAGGFKVRVKVKEAELSDPDAGDISTAIMIGGDGFLNTQKWQPKAKGKKLVTP